MAGIGAAINTGAVNRDGTVAVIGCGGDRGRCPGVVVMRLRIYRGRPSAAVFVI